MRFAFLLLFAVAACDSNVENMTTDLAMHDLSVKDAGGGGLSCKDSETCASACTPADINTCIPACIAQVDTAAKPFFDALEQCSGPACTISDAGPGPCLAPNSADCATCVMQKCGTALSNCLAH
jgi:hypothetical protein